MGLIRQLPEAIAIKIAAGEVVERPASVVKELVENALDAGATRIEVAIKDGGKTSISILDNGSGMDRDDAVAAFLRHGTSKIHQVDDLLHVATLGFRGEALAAIAASAEVELQTTLRDAHEGTLVTVNHGVIVNPRPNPPLPGTRITVTDLFHALPARQKFLKSDTTEWKACFETLTRQMIAHPAVAWIIRHNDRAVIDAPGGQTFGERVALVWKVTSDQLIPLHSEVPHMQLTGVLGTPELAHHSPSSSKSRQFFAVNGHPIFDKAIARSLRDAYGTLLPPHISPVYALTLQIHPGMVDVNIHPRKDEVRFVNPQEVFRFTLQSVSQALASRQSSFSRLENLRPATPLPAVSAPQFAPAARHEPPTALHTPRTLPARQSRFEPTFAVPVTEQEPAKSLADPIVTVSNCYLVMEYEGKLLLVDQHAAHERLLYNQFVDRHTKQSSPAQKLLVPLALNLAADELALVEEHTAAFQSLGFTFSTDYQQLLEVPNLIGHRNPEQFFRQVLAGLQEERTEPELTDFTHKLFATMACKAAIKAGDAVSEVEKHKLITDLLAAPNTFTCPHGRPSYILVSSNELEKLFKRIGFS